MIVKSTNYKIKNNVSIMINVELIFKSSLIIIIIVLECLVLPTPAQDCCEEYCYDQDISMPFRPQYKNLGQRNSYDFIKGTDYQIYNLPGGK